MSNNFKDARKSKKLSAVEAARLLNVSQPTISAWEREVKTPSIGALEKMANLYDVSTDYLLGRIDTQFLNMQTPINPKHLLLYDGKPVWSKTYGWLLIDASKKQFVSSKGEILSFNIDDELFVLQPDSTFLIPTNINPLSKNELENNKEVWVEPISSDQYLKNELRGYYKVMGFFVENSSGNRFMIDKYEVNWLAFKTNI